MKKTLIASAITAATLSTSAFAMDQASDLAEMLESMPDVYGNIQLAHISTDTNSGAPGAKDVSFHELVDNGSTIGFKHDHAISEDVTGFFKAEFHFDADGSKYHNDGGNSANQALGEALDEAYIGVKGDFGSAQVGADDTVYEWVDMIDTFEVWGLNGGEIAADTEGDNFQYVSPEIADGLVLGATVPFDSDSTFGGSLAAKYSMDNLSVALAYSLGRKEGAAEAGDTIGLAGSFAIDDLTLIAQYETRDEGASNAQDGMDFWALQGIYAMGANQFQLGYGMTSYDPSAAEDTSSIFFQALHNMSDNMYVYLEYTTQTDVGGVKDAEADLLAVGATYYF